jgi:hypothetical protein
MVGAEQAIEPGEVDGEVDVDRFPLNPVVPMVEPGRDEPTFYRPEVDPDV